jgi:predicted CXXCH cytochrome family protein
LGGALVNNPNVLAGAAVSLQGGEITGKANLGIDLTNDHPVGFSFADVLAVDSGIQGPTDAAVKVNFGTSGDQMWCSSCHDVHNNTNEPFLAMDNAGSALCLQCHNK